MKKLLLALGLILSTSCFSWDEVTCFSHNGDSVIYDGYGKNFQYEQHGAYLYFRERATNSNMYIFGSCIVKIDRPKIIVKK